MVHTIKTTLQLAGIHQQCLLITPPPPPLHPPPTPQLYLHGVVVQAERAFARLCPGDPFWPPPPQPDDEGEYQAELLRAAASAVTGKTNDTQEQDAPEQEAEGATSVTGGQEEGADPVPPQEEGSREEVEK